MRFAVVPLYETNSPLSKIDWCSLGGLDKGFAILMVSFH